MCALDFMTNRKLKKLKRNGKVSRCECLLMYQMITNSLLTLVNTIGYFALGFFLQMFIGYNLNYLFGETIVLIQALFFSLFASIISALCLRKRPGKARSENGRTVITVASAPASMMH
ncbi:unnamed protein product, partial [Mesorhabditis belari]|uniref:Uncharacterized protein n=1 Tax=Mesorhabditis belari TaxID=2138241 RepID=A0AAF3FIZ1_9BILA